MDFSFFWRGLIIGFSIAAPVGPIGVLCIRRTLAEGRLAGFISGMGAATADALYGAVAGFGLTAVSELLISQKTALRLVGGIFLLYLGFKTFRSKPAEQSASIQAPSLLATYLSTFFLTVTNPTTILSFVAVFAGIGLGSGSDFTSAGTLVTGVFLGSAAWWLFLCLGTGSLRSRMKTAHLQWINRCSGLVIAGFGLLALLSLKK